MQHTQLANLRRSSYRSQSPIPAYSAVTKMPRSFRVTRRKPTLTRTGMTTSCTTTCKRMADSSLHPASEAAEQGRKRVRLPSLPRGDSSSSFVPPRVASSLSRRRHLPVRDAVRALALAVVPGTEELHASLCTRAVSSKAGYWVPKSRQDDPFLQKVLTAKNLQLERLPFRDAYLYQYGLLPDQYVPPRDDHAISLHPCDKVDAKLPQSLLRMEAMKRLGEGRMPCARREVSAWDGTVKNVTAPLLWRTREPLF